MHVATASYIVHVATASYIVHVATASYTVHVATASYTVHVYDYHTMNALASCSANFECRDNGNTYKIMIISKSLIK